MTALAPLVDHPAAANPFATFIDPRPCMEAHLRLGDLPHQAHRPLDRRSPVTLDERMVAADFAIDRRSAAQSLKFGSL